MAFDFDGASIEPHPGDSILAALLRAGQHPTGGGCLCFGGDCPNCLVTVDGVAYVRACQTPAADGLTVLPHAEDGYPPLPTEWSLDDVDFSIIHADVVVIGQGESGVAAAEAARAEGKDVITLDSTQGRDAVGIYPGVYVVARTTEGMHRIYADEIVIATGASEIQPACPGNDLSGIATPRAAAAMLEAGLDLGRVLEVGTPAGIGTPVEGRLVRFEGNGSVDAVVVRDESGAEHRHECDTAVVGLGLDPRNALARMANGLPGVRVVGDAAGTLDVPPCPESGTVCPCADVTVDQLESVWERGFHELELIKRATLAGTGTCQGSACMPHVRSFVASKGVELPESFTARPVTKQITIAEAIAGHHLPVHMHTALHEEHLALDADMDNMGGWMRPWNYGDVEREYQAVREAVSIGDVSTLGKIIVSGPDAEAFLERIYPTTITTIKKGRSKYVLNLDEGGYVMDDGLVCRDDDTRFFLTFTSSGANHAEMWLRDWAETWGHDVRILNRTASWGAINITGPKAAELLGRLGATDLPTFMGHGTVTLRGIENRIFRLSFTGEASYEIHHPAEHSVELWRALMAEGEDLGIRPHGIEALQRLRLEKGHIIVGMDSLPDSSPQRLDHDWAVRMDKPEFIGRQALVRTRSYELDKKLVGLEMDGPAPHQGSIVRIDGEYHGFVTSVADSPMVGRIVMLAWLYAVDGVFAEEVEIDGRPAGRVSLPFYDKEHARART